MRKRESRSVVEELREADSPVRPTRLIAAAAGLHLAATAAVYLTGRFGFAPGVFDANGIGVSFAPDAYGYQAQAVALCEQLTRDGAAAWLAAPSQFHVKLYSLSFAVLNPLFGFTVLSAEPLNLLYYLAILCLVFKLGREAFDGRVGVLAAGAVALWPSLLIHTTQLLRDPLFIVAVLGLVLISSRWLTRIYSWRGGAAAGAAGGGAGVVLWILRRDMWEVMLAVAVLALGLLMIRQLREKRMLTGNLIGAGMVLVVILTAPRFGAMFQRPGFPLTQASEKGSSEMQTAHPVDVQPGAPAGLTEEHAPTLPSQLRARIESLRHGFRLLYPGATSNIDTEVRFASLADIALYLPRAMAIGFCAPFPNMWLATGKQVGLIGRMTGGLETLVMYVIEVFAVLGLWRKRRCLFVWLLFLVALIGVTALGLVVTNMGALYRMRYVFWMLLIILGAEGLRRTLSVWSPGRSGIEKSIPLV